MKSRISIVAYVAAACLSAGLIGACHHPTAASTPVHTRNDGANAAAWFQSHPVLPSLRAALSHVAPTPTTSTPIATPDVIAKAQSTIFAPTAPITPAPTKPARRGAHANHTASLEHVAKPTG